MRLSAGEPGAEGEHVDDLGLTYDDWDALRIAYNFGTLEPTEGSVEEEAFLRMAEEGRRAWDRHWESEKRDEAYQRFQQHPFPGGPLTAHLTSREAAKLSGKLYSAHRAAQKAAQEADRRSAQDQPFWEMQTEIWGLCSDAQAETIVSGVRQPGETSKEFTRRAWREPDKMSEFDRTGRVPQANPELGLWDAEPEAE
jgi:hypothetical protein